MVSPFQAKFQIACAILCIFAQTCSGATPQAVSMGFAGVEYFGSSQVTRLELSKMVSLKPGASFQSVQRAADKLAHTLDARHLAANVEVVQAGDGTIYIAVDVSDSSTDSVAVRNLKAPHHVLVRSEKPFMVLAQLDQRLQTLDMEGRPPTESFQDGLKTYSDEASNQYIVEIERFAPTMIPNLLEVVDSDPDPRRRKAAVDILGWAGDIPEVASRLLPALDDSDPKVRASVVRYFFPRLTYLPDNFAYDALLDGLSREISRPSHQDRSKGLYLLLALAKKNTVFIRPIKELCGARIKQLAEESIIPTVTKPAADLLQVIDQFEKAPSPKYPRILDGPGF